jgi:hypothetical protein
MIYIDLPETFNYSYNWDSNPLKLEKDGIFITFSLGGIVPNSATGDWGRIWSALYNTAVLEIKFPEKHNHLEIENGYYKLDVEGVYVDPMSIMDVYGEQHLHPEVITNDPSKYVAIRLVSDEGDIIDNLLFEPDQFNSHIQIIDGGEHIIIA